MKEYSEEVRRREEHLFYYWKQGLDERPLWRRFKCPFPVDQALIDRVLRRQTRINQEMLARANYDQKRDFFWASCGFWYGYLLTTIQQAKYFMPISSLAEGKALSRLLEMEEKHFSRWLGELSR